MDRDILVSVIVVSYNSSKTICDTLDSIYRQTYSPIELIISDDCSSDNTVEVAREWACRYGDRFVRCLVHKNEKNLGVPGNCNSGILLSDGAYVKLLAADDLLLTECIQQNLECCLNNDYNVLFSNVYPFYMENGEKKRLNFSINKAFFEKSAAEQYPDELLMNQVFTPTVFYSRKLLDEMNLFDCAYHYIEDYPMHLKLLRSGHKLNFMDSYTVEYRISEKSLSNTQARRSVHPGYHRDCKRLFYRERVFGLLRYGKVRVALGAMRHFLRDDIIILLRNIQENR